MAHTCPFCDMLCHCNGDIDDIDLGHEPEEGCIHYLSENCDDYDHDGDEDFDDDDHYEPLD